MEPGQRPIEESNRYQYQTALEEITKGSDRNAAILAASMLDYNLKHILISFLIDRKETVSLFRDTNAPLTTLSGRINLAYALGLIAADEYEDCHIFRKIRNDFAHRFEVNFSFQDPEISKLSKKLKNNLFIGEGRLFGGAGELTEARESFNLAIEFLSTRLEDRANFVIQQRLTEVKWPGSSLDDYEYQVI
ncbi:hypothetical protein F1C16_07325 [Hymenobacter sp. NBH84]|uniref:MltR family transcriptional regulator n=1 Tax=Hymenobacter sp. NBH84 TaxID=2596915 RepID=UPI00162A1F50|nr:MltR family transcriptional regulator [Hymenobacter sp. NBH84]QNE39381.1 hypothetical protein F1C16_07325 [Hymenobacter sp. NBH84]